MVPARSPQHLWRGLESGWSALSYLFGGIALYGGLGYLLDRLLGTDPVLLVVGVLFGNALGVYLLYLRWPERDGGPSGAA